MAGKPIIDPALTSDEASNSVTKRVGGKLVLRPSSIASHCPYSYAQNAILGLKSKPSGASAGGTAYHYALELAYDHKIQTGALPPVADIIEIGRENWRAVQTVEELHYSSKDSPDKMTDDLANGLASYYPTMNHIIPVATETRLRVALPKPSSVYSEISGSIDLLAKGNIVRPKIGGGTETIDGVDIIDHKFTTKKSTTAKYRLQAGMYRVMVESNGMVATGSVLHNMIRSEVLKTKSNPTRLELVRPDWNEATKQVLRSKLTELIDRAELVTFLTHDLSVDPADAVKVVYPTTTPEASFLCNELWCGYFWECPINNQASMPKLNLLDLISQYRNSKGGM